MRRAVLILPFVFACAKSETPATDSMAAATAMPAALTDADFSGTWTGTATMAGTDSVIAHWTQVCGGGSCTGTSQEAPDTVRSSYTIDADSSHGVSAAFSDPTAGGPKMVDHWIARVSSGSVSGHGWYVLADKPDSVVMRYTFQGTRSAQ